MLLNRENLMPNVELYVDGEHIENIIEFKFLGIKLDNQLNFEAHHKDLCGKLTSGSFIIKQLGKMLPSTCLRHLYFAYYHSHLANCLSTWWNLLKKSHQDTIVMMQKCIVRAVCKVNFRQHCMPLFRKEKILRVCDLYLLDNYKLI